tara:strand:+ start:1631 stop:2251 length:621 start_codon:yes stop_codon:yes gene_type:complete
MANHVQFMVTFHQINEAATTKLNEMYGRIRNEEGSHAWFSDMFVEGDLTYEDSEKFSWTTENIGPKWCYLEEFNGESFNGTSAWSAPEDGLVKLLEILEQFDPDIITSITYEDECPNFAGCNVYEGSDNIDSTYSDGVEIREMVIYESEFLTEESWNDEDDEWANEEAEEAFNEELWETLNNSHWTFINDTVQAIGEEQVLRAEGG